MTVIVGFSLSYGGRMLLPRVWGEIRLLGLLRVLIGFGLWRGVKQILGREIGEMDVRLWLSNGLDRQVESI